MISLKPSLFVVALGGTVSYFSAQGEYREDTIQPAARLLHSAIATPDPMRNEAGNLCLGMREFSGVSSAISTLKESDELTMEDMHSLVDIFHNSALDTCSNIIITVGKKRQLNVLHYLCTGKWVQGELEDHGFLTEDLGLITHTKAVSDMPAMQRFKIVLVSVDELIGATDASVESLVNFGEAVSSLTMMNPGELAAIATSPGRSTAPVH